jgi:undecaprenyl diphosphate synthase
MTIEKLDPTGDVPAHIAIIMDGNGRWATMRSLPRTAGHRAGVQTVQSVVEASDELGVKVLTLYTFSTENWQRPLKEVETLMILAEEYARRKADELHRRNIQMQHLGRREGLPASALEAIDHGVHLTRHNTGLVLNLAMNYGGRVEIVDAARAIVAARRRGELSVDDLDEATFARYLYTAGLADPDLIIRTGGEIRLSNFLIWQAAGGTRFWSTPIYWPDFTRQHLMDAIAAWRQENN